ncbi:MAG: hypothetical protein ACXVQ0_00695 [Actinomycetota bacterium]
MPKDQPTDQPTDRRDRETRGGYPAGGKPISEFTPPPTGPAPGGKRRDDADHEPEQESPL